MTSFRGDFLLVKNLSRMTLVFGLTLFFGSLPFKYLRADTINPPQEFLCRDENRFLTDEEFLEIAFQHEVRERNLPEPFRSLGIAGLRELDPGCCSVLREDNPFNEPRGWLDRLLFDPQILVHIGWDTDPDTYSGSDVFTSYGFWICGELRERYGSTKGLFKD